MTIRVLLADDQPLVRAGLRTILSTERGIDVVGEAANGQLAVALAGRVQPDVVLMDIRMPDMDGLEATRRLRSAGAIRPWVVVLTTFQRDDYLFAALRAGASGFLLKDASPDRLVEAVRVVYGGEALLAPAVTRQVIEACARGPVGFNPPAGWDELTPREKEIFGYLARGRSNADISAELVLGDATIKTHVQRVFRKLALRDRAHAVIVAYESGLVRAGEST